MTEPHFVSVNWVITYRCNADCIYCLTDSVRYPQQPEMSAKEKIRAVEVLASLGVRRISILGGEPFILRELSAVIRCAYMNGITVNITTSGKGVTVRQLEAVQNGVQYLNISLDGPQEVNDSFRWNGSYRAAINTLKNVQTVGIPARIYVVLRKQNADSQTIDWLFQTARTYGVNVLMIIFLSPTGRAKNLWEARIPPAEREPVLKLLRDASQKYGISFKNADPYEPESYRMFVDANGSTYKHPGKGVKIQLGSLFGNPDDLWMALTSEERTEHWKQFYDLPVIESHPEDLEDMVYIPPGIFMMGGTQKVREQPQHPVYVDGFYMDRYQVTNQQFAQFLTSCGNQSEAGKRWLNIESPNCLIEFDVHEFRPKQGFEHYPVVEVSWYGANAYAQWKGKRLPTEAEWEKAALGGINGQVYPWGNTPPDNQCNWLEYRGEFADLRPDFYHGRGPLPVGKFSPNSYGIYDLAGNVWEWCQDWYAPDIYSEQMRFNPTGPEFGQRKVLRGGSWSFSGDNLRIANRSYAFPENGYSYDGFRCVVSNIDRLMQRYNLK